MTYLTVQEVAELARCAQNTVRAAINTGKLTAFKGPKRFLVREEDARAWVEGEPVVPSMPAPYKPRASSRQRVARGSVADLKAIERRTEAA